MVDYDAFKPGQLEIRKQFEDLTKLTVFDTNDWDEALWGRLRLEVGGTAGIKTVGELIRRVHEYIHVYGIKNTPPSPNGLNRRFGRAAKALGTSVTGMLDFLGSIGAVVIYDRAGRVAVLSKPNVDLIRETLGPGKPFDEAIDRILSQTDQ